MAAQAIVERGVLESAVLGIGEIVTNVGGVVHDYPYLTIALVILAGVLLIKRL
jgi:hypothetical protein